MAYEFKNIATVDLVEEVAETSNVLIEENGIIKRAPKKKVGGDTEWDAVFIVDDIYNISANTVANIVHLTSGSFDAIVNKINNDDLPKVLVVNYFEYGDSMKACSQGHCEYNITDNVINIYYHTNWGTSHIDNYGFSLASDGTISTIK